MHNGFLIKMLRQAQHDKDSTDSHPELFEGFQRLFCISAYYIYECIGLTDTSIRFKSRI